MWVLAALTGMLRTCWTISDVRCRLLAWSYQTRLSAWFDRYGSILRLLFIKGRYEYSKKKTSCLSLVFEPLAATQSTSFVFVLPHFTQHGLFVFCLSLALLAWKALPTYNLEAFESAGTCIETWIGRQGYNWFLTRILAQTRNPAAKQ